MPDFNLFRRPTREEADKDLSDHMYTVATGTYAPEWVTGFSLDLRTIGDKISTQSEPMEDERRFPPNRCPLCNLYWGDGTVREFEVAQKPCPECVDKFYKEYHKEG